MEKQEVLAQAKAHIERLIAQTNQALVAWESASAAWEKDQSDATGEALEKAMRTYHDATAHLATYLNSLYRTGYRVTVHSVGAPRP